MGCPRQCTALLRKQWLQRSRSWVPSLLEFALPLAFVVGMLGLSRAFSTTTFSGASHAEDVTRVAPLFALPAALAWWGARWGGWRDAWWWPTTTVSGRGLHDRQNLQA